MTTDSESVDELEGWFRDQVAELWPAALGSLSLRRSPCVRGPERCYVCQSGELHASYVLYGRIEGKRFSVYIPDELAPKLRRAIRNGRKLQAVLQETGRRYALALKRERDRRGS
ncbi:MAG: hypothetical protein ACRD2Z_05340 [Thermoanaerobaculia bacterium]